MRLLPQYFSCWLWTLNTHKISGIPHYSCTRIKCSITMQATPVAYHVLQCGSMYNTMKRKNILPRQTALIPLMLTAYGLSATQSFPLLESLCHQPNTKEYEGNSLCDMVTQLTELFRATRQYPLYTNRIKLKWRQLFYNTNYLYQDL